MSQLVSESLPPVAGSPGLTQGAYGELGNLELVVPGRADGIWVFWFNADAVEHHAGAALGCWSGGLHVFAGHPVAAARISQLRAGPRFLEVLALSEQVVHRLYWTPERGFVDGGAIAAGISEVSPVHETADELWVDVVRADGACRRLVGDLLRYPSVEWTVRERAEPVAQQLVPPGFPDTGYDALAWCESSLDGGRIEIVLRTGAELAHVHGTSGAWSDPEPIVSRVWADADTPTVHRR